MCSILPTSAAAYQRVLTNTLTDLIYRATRGDMKPKKIARDLEQLGIQLADAGADNETLATVLELAARLRNGR
jgi:hypothetical protein